MIKFPFRKGQPTHGPLVWFSWDCFKSLNNSIGYQWIVQYSSNSFGQLRNRIDSVYVTPPLSSPLSNSTNIFFGFEMINYNKTDQMLYNASSIDIPWSSLVEGYKVCIGPSGKLLCLWQTSKNIKHMHSIIPYMFDCWTDPVAHLLLLKSSVVLIRLFVRDGTDHHPCLRFGLFK